MITITCEPIIVQELGGVAGHTYSKERRCAVVYVSSIINEKPVDLPMREEEYRQHTPYTLARIAKGHQIETPSTTISS